MRAGLWVWDGNGSVGGALGGSLEGGRGRSTGACPGAPGCRGIVAAAVRLRAPAVVLQAVVDVGEARLVGRVAQGQRVQVHQLRAHRGDHRGTAGLARSLDLSLMRGLDAVGVSVPVALTWGGNGYVGGGARSSPRRRGEAEDGGSNNHGDCTWNTRAAGRRRLRLGAPGPSSPSTSQTRTTTVKATIDTRRHMLVAELLGNLT